MGNINEDVFANLKVMINYRIHSTSLFRLQRSEEHTSELQSR